MTWIAAQILGSALMTAAGVAAARRSRNAATGLVASMLFLILAKVGIGWLSEGEARFLPWDWYPLLENWWFLFPAMAIFGVAMGLFHRSMWRRDALLVGAGLLIVRCAAIGGALGRPSDLIGTVDPQGTCRQTSGYSCSAASAAMLLHRHGIAATEREMAELCVTMNGGIAGGGTSASGLMRGLRLKTDEPRRIRIGRPAYDLLPTPSIISLRLSPTLTHSVLLERVTPEAATVVDPLYGRGTLNRGIFDREWMGSAIWIE